MLIAEGKTHNQIGRDLDLSSKTVKTSQHYLKQAGVEQPGGGGCV
ncbi:MAG: response regulator transcription factor [Thermoanaerobacteraceae bacterium]|nr:response regulator transcription factor [Thermoanaerobacteraceae bacterium]